LRNVFHVVLHGIIVGYLLGDWHLHLSAHFFVLSVSPLVRNVFDPRLSFHGLSSLSCYSCLDYSCLDWGSIACGGVCCSGISPGICLSRKTCGIRDCRRGWVTCSDGTGTNGVARCATVNSTWSTYEASGISSLGWQCTLHGHSTGR
jgi:hypothetical protein